MSSIHIYVDNLKLLTGGDKDGEEKETIQGLVWLWWFR
jgi:hypothetical protein